MGLALGNDGKPVPSMAGSFCGLIPKGAKNVEVAKDFLKYLIQPEVLNEYLKTGLGRREPPMPSIVKKDPWWLDPKDPHRVAYTTQVVLGPTVPHFWVFNPAWAQVESEHVWQEAWADDHEGRGGAGRRRPKRRSSGPRRSLRNTRSRKADGCRTDKQALASRVIDAPGAGPNSISGRQIVWRAGARRVTPADATGVLTAR